MISKRTTEDVMRVVTSYLPLTKALMLFTDLSKVEGNASYKQSITALKDMVAEEIKYYQTRIRR